MALAGELQIDPMMREPLAIHAFAKTACAQQIDRALFQHPRAQPSLDVGAIMALQHHRFDPMLVQQMGQHQARGTGADNRDLCTHGMHSS